MDFSKKYDISVYLTEEQLNKRIAEIGAQITEKYNIIIGIRRMICTVKVKHIRFM